MGAQVIPQGGWRIHNYKVPEDILMGFEYEIHCGARKAARDEALQTKLPSHYSYAWEDLGSASGYEIKSSVAPLRTLKMEVNGIREFLEWSPYSAEESAGGIHINISRTDYTVRHSPKVFDFLHSPSNYLFLFKLSKRNHHSFDLYSPQINWKAYPYLYYSIITTRKSYAYEMRMFGAEPRLLKPALEFCHALFSLASEVDAITQENLKAYIKGKIRYSNIHQLIRDLKL